MRRNFFTTRYTPEEKKFISLSSKNKMLSTLSSDEVMLLYPHMYKKKYQLNEVVFFTGDPALAIYLLEEGKVTLNIEHKKRLEKFDTLGAGSMFGESAIAKLSRQIRSYTSLVVSEEAEIWVIPSLAFQDVLEENIKLKAKIMEFLVFKYVPYVNMLFKMNYKESIFFELERIENSEIVK